MAKRLIITSILCICCSPLYANNKIDLVTFDYPPLVEIDDDGQVKGTSWNVVKRLLIKTQISHTLTVKPAERGLFTTSNRENTCIFPIDRTQKREALFSWVGPIAINQYAFYSAPDESIPLLTLADAKDYNMTTYLGASIGGYLKGKGFNIRQTGSMKQGLLMLKYNRTDLWVSDVNSANKLAQKYQIELGEPELVFFTSINYMACHPEMPSAQLKKMEQALNEMYISSEIQELLHVDL